MPESNGPQQNADQSGALETDGGSGRPEEAQLSVNALSRAFAELLDQGDEAVGSDTVLAQSDADHQAELFVATPRSILEALLFVGNANNQPLAKQQAASLLRGVSTAEIERFVHELNKEFQEDGCPYHVVLEGAGYRMTLRGEFAALRDKFYGRIRRARLSQAAIDVLAIVAYNQPLNRQRVEKLRGRPSSSILRQLVRRRLLLIDRSDSRPRRVNYRTTDRFLRLFGLESLSELPRSQDFESNV